jgi:hypothetical protein
MNRPTRRQFTASLALAAASPLALATDAGAQAPRPDRATLTATAEALAGVVRARHGKDLTDKQLKQVQQSVLRSLSLANRLQAFKLAGADEPDFTFTADVP